MSMSNINIRVDTEVKEESTKILESLGLDMTTAVNIYLRQIVDNNGIPFFLQRRFNAETEAAIEESRKIMSGEIKAKTYDNVEEMFDEILTEPDE